MCVNRVKLHQQRITKQRRKVGGVKKKKRQTHLTARNICNAALSPAENMVIFYNYKFCIYMGNIPCNALKFKINIIYCLSKCAVPNEYFSFFFKIQILDLTHL